MLNWPLLQVTMVSDEQMRCFGRCAGMLLGIQGELFAIDFFLLSLDICNVVLGAQWLRTLSPIMWDFERMSMRLVLRGRELEIKGMRPPLNSVVEERSFGRELKRRKEGWVC